MGEIFTGPTEVQQSRLRHVAGRLTSEEIAQRTGLTCRTVDQYLSRATTLLRAANRAKLRANSCLGEFKKVQLKSLDLADAAPSAILQPSERSLAGFWPMEPLSVIASNR